MKRHAFRAGDWVIVRSPSEILSSLDTDGTLNGLPFMPEMADWCGKRFRVERRAEKTCVDVAPPLFPNRRFGGNHVVFLEGPRCDGRSHDGCKRGCKIFWNEAWLRPARSGERATATSSSGRGALISRLRTKPDEKHYFCQSTELHRATRPFPGNRKLWRLRVAFREIRNRDRSALELLRLFALWCWLRLSKRMRGSLSGPHQRAPSASFELKPGDRVNVKSRVALLATLDHRGTNRGLKICPEMLRYCGAQAEVDTLVDRIIDERTGEIRQLASTVTLRNVRNNRIFNSSGFECLCGGETGDCPRGERMYWREIWLERVNSEI